MTSPVHVVQHPLLAHKLALLRSQATPPPLFRALVRDLSVLLFYEASRTLRLQPITVHTPLGPCPAQQLQQRIGLMPILRAGLGMAAAILELLPEACVWHLGLYRDHKTLQPVTYYNKLPASVDLDVCFVVDPMLATGGSAVAAIDMLKRGGAAQIHYLGLIAAPEGVQAVQQAHPEVSLFLAALDSHLNEHCYIVPGLGDAGDRQFATL